MIFYLVAGIGILAAMNSTQESVFMTSKRLYNLPDVLPENQQGTFSRDYDVSFEKFADKTGVPFALMKAHAIQESSLNPNAFTNENPKGESSREGWASRGLMQVLWWPGSGRMSKYGYEDRDVGLEGGSLFDPDINCDIASQIIKANLQACGGNLRDAINMYNTGKKEADFPAPGNYVDKVLNYYETIIGKKV